MAMFRPEVHHHLIGKKWVRDLDGKDYELTGIVFGEDDWYWLMQPAVGPTEWLSCVGKIENFGYTPKEVK